MSERVIAKQIVIYSDDSNVRKSITAALGKQVSAEVGPHQIHEFATADALRAYIDSKSVDGTPRADLFILDGEATPEGGMSVARQLKDEVFNCPPVVLIIGRPDDAWLASWSRAESVISQPIDPFTLAARAAQLLIAGSSVLS